MLVFFNWPQLLHGNEMSGSIHSQKLHLIKNDSKQYKQ